jgi:lysophospholipase
LIGLLYGAWPRPVVSVVVFVVTMLGLGWMFLPGHRRGPLGRKDFPGNPLTLDRERWMRDSGVLETAPSLGTGGPTFSWLKSARRATRKLQALGPGDNLTSPLLIVSAGLDRVVDSEASYRFSKRVPGVSLVTLRESLHEILTERDAIRQQFLAIFDAFIDG